MVLWHVDKSQRVRYTARHKKQEADLPVLTKGDSPAFFPRLQDSGIGCHCPFDGKDVRQRYERITSLLSHPCWG